ncbi:Flagellar motor switch protein fliN [Ketogulonicigenium robustum]|uniref:Flagellar motor switch protein FliN n=1 Tax=Ketogulonicigenium robustum TaxID=92947 RepID=A0A1W6P1N6_9RHOB|nr:Flagellar motor switch protein fliN [Ketogulonicigenium robustum]
MSELAPDHKAMPEGANPALWNVPIEVTIAVGRSRPSVRELLALEENAVLQLDRRIDDPVEIYIGDRLIARGELQESEDEPGQLAVRLTEVASNPGERL